jgi:hypothetical protein
MKSFFFALLLLFSTKSFAWMADLTADIVSEAFTTASEQKTTRQFISIDAVGDLGKSETFKYYLGWEIISASFKDSNSAPSVDQTISSLDMGPVFRMHFDRNGIYSFSFNYGVYAKGSLSTAAGSEKLTGTSMHLKFAAEPQISEHFNIGFALNYYAASYGKSVLGTTESSVSYKTQRMFPSLSVSYRY